jgi:hypothetical protein
VRNQQLSTAGLWLELASAEKDMGAHGKGSGIKVVTQACSGRRGLDRDSPEKSIQIVLPWGREPAAAGVFHLRLSNG